MSGASRRSATATTSAYVFAVEVVTELLNAIPSAAVWRPDQKYCYKKTAIEVSGFKFRHHDLANVSAFGEVESSIDDGDTEIIGIHISAGNRLGPPSNFRSYSVTTEQTVVVGVD